MLRFAALCLAGTLIAAPAFADSPFDGTWKGQLSGSTMDAKAQTWSIKNGVYSCATCTPPYTTKADGTYHALPGHDYWDEVKITVVDPHTVTRSYRKGGKEISLSTDTVSADGNTLTSVSHNTNNGGGVAVDATGSATRTAPPPAGAHMISGSWMPKIASSVSDAALMMTIKVDGDMLHLKTGTGETLDAKIGGDWAPNVGDPGKTMTKVERAGANGLKMTDQRGGKTVQVTNYTVAADGKTLVGDWTDPTDGSKGTFKAVKL